MEVERTKKKKWPIYYRERRLLLQDIKNYYEATATTILDKDSHTEADQRARMQSTETSALQVCGVFEGRAGPPQQTEPENRLNP